jgi:hypothetical protein
VTRTSPIAFFRIALVLLLAFVTAPASAQFSSPLASSRVTSHVSHISRGRLVNYACTPISRSGHRGTDFGVGIGNTVSAAASGTVIRVVEGCSNAGSLSSRCGGGFGNHVIVAHDDGRASLYAHLTPGSIAVRQGQRVECGARLGQSGNSGRSTGPHLHFEVRSGGIRDVGDYYQRGATDPYGGPCSTQAHSLWNGGATPRVTCSSRPVPGDDARFVRAAHPDTIWVQPGRELTQTWTLRNTGTTRWTTSGGYRLEHVGGPSLDGLRRMDVRADVAPNTNGDFSVTVRAPTAPGTYTAQYRMRSDTNPGFGTVVTVRIRVPNPPRSCSSMTLGRNVPSGECVQVSYAACGAASCAWFRCADGAWQCTAEASCGGETHENPACDDPATRACAGAAEPCENVSECCGGLLCAAGATGERQCCAGPEMRCESDGDCCGQMRCGAAGRCECVPVGGRASSTLECCGSAYLTRDGTCGYDT